MKCKWYIHQPKCIYICILCTKNILFWNDVFCRLIESVLKVKCIFFMVASPAVCHSMSKSIIVWQFFQYKHYFLSDNKKSKCSHKSTLIVICPTVPGNLSYQGGKLYFPRDNNCRSTVGDPFLIQNCPTNTWCTFYVLKCLLAPT